MASGDLSPAELKDMIPMTVPTTHLVDGFPGIARYPLNEWESAGEPCFSTESWCKLTMKVATKDMENLGTLFDIAEKIEATLKDD